jgi:phage N-6-adenine-methyltransferase
VVLGFKAANHPQQTGVRGARDDIDDRGTDPLLFVHIERILGHFTLDVAASDDNAKCERYLTRYAQPDGLAASWAGESVWCNPPYSDLGAWVQKAWREWLTVDVDDFFVPVARPELIVMLVPSSRTEQGWWQDHIEPHRDYFGGVQVVFLRGRRRFVRVGADSIGPNERPPFGSCLLVWRHALLTPTERAGLAAPPPIEAASGPDKALTL